MKKKIKSSFNQCPKLQLGLNAQYKMKILNALYYLPSALHAAKSTCTYIMATKSRGWWLVQMSQQCC